MTTLPCQCTGCPEPHPKGCRAESAWYIEFHPVDYCKVIEALRGTACQECFDRLVAHCNDLITQGREGRRPPVCFGCSEPIVRMSHVMRDVAKL